MFEEIKAWLDSLTPKEKENLIRNMRKFSLTLNLLKAKGVVVHDLQAGKMIIKKDHDFVDDLIKYYRRLTMRGITLIDDRQGQNLKIE